MTKPILPFSSRAAWSPSYERTIELNYIKLNALMERTASDRYEVVKPILDVSLPKIESF